MRICSFLPSGTEILFALGLGDSVVGVTFECDYPAEARSKAVVVYTKLTSGLPEREIDRQVNEFSQQGRSLYRLDADKLRELKPDLIVTQDLCHVCAASPDDLGAVLGTLSPCPQVLALAPRTIARVWNDIITVGNATGRTAEAAALVGNLERKIAQLRKDRGENHPRVLCLEWLDPPFAAGHWVPEMVKLAGGIDVLGRADSSDALRLSPRGSRSRTSSGSVSKDLVLASRSAKWAGVCHGCQQSFLSPWSAYCGRGCCTGGNFSRTDSRSPQKISFSGPWLG